LKRWLRGKDIPGHVVLDIINKLQEREARTPLKLAELTVSILAASGHRDVKGFMDAFEMASTLVREVDNMTLNRLCEEKLRIKEALRQGIGQFTPGSAYYDLTSSERYLDLFKLYM
jgi:hypothetical protein